MRTGKLAAILKVHPNTLRWYEKAGYLPSVPRTAAGYREYCPELVRLARVVRESQPLLRIYGPIRKTAFAFLRACREDCIAQRQGSENKSWFRYPASHAATLPYARLPYTASIRRLDELKLLLHTEHRLALDALAALERFQHRSGSGYCHGCGESEVGGAGLTEGALLRSGPLRYIGKVAILTGLSRDQIINWERDGLCRYPRTAAGYRLFGPEDVDRLLIIRSCRTAGYSITAIRRLLCAVDEAATGGAGEIAAGGKLRVVADTPANYETEIFPAFPTDTLPATLENLIALTERLDALLRAP